ncbi:transcriptional regulator [Streptococcus pneumoniae]|nr:transcriptional regulator [Streptococcus pneumoniae]VJN50421.1 transcriptional regulator [Streptococcus pneumoniae]VJW24795.1 transcriptional regulator [Streptococcus pneumoniae]VKC17776.1 transcriptional regulator [Streptococcus pneumoniae]VKJ81521.1 transcriptional regulator [Streptococcus pneumoniae]
MKNRLEEIRKENGRYNPSIILAFKIAKYFNLTIEDIFIYEEVEKNEKK